MLGTPGFCFVDHFDHKILAPSVSVRSRLPEPLWTLLSSFPTAPCQGHLLLYQSRALLSAAFPPVKKAGLAVKSMAGHFFFFMLEQNPNRLVFKDQNFELVLGILYKKKKSKNTSGSPSTRNVQCNEE